MTVLITRVSNRVEICRIWLLNLNIGTRSVVVILDSLQLLLLQMRREIILLLVIEIVNSTNFLVSFFCVLLWRFAIRLRQDQRLVYVRRNRIWLRETILSKMCISRHDRLHHWYLLRIPYIFHNIQIGLYRPRVVAISYLILILKQHLLLVKCIFITLQTHVTSTNPIIGVDIFQFRWTSLFNTPCEVLHAQIIFHHLHILNTLRSVDFVLLSVGLVL
jgi:hypothetical protein